MFILILHLKLENQNFVEGAQVGVGGSKHYLISDIPESTCACHLIIIKKCNQEYSVNLYRNEKKKSINAIMAHNKF